ncbi:putative thiazole-containing bacteriocin maturation protein [Bacillus sonorensis]|uniref:putative thiazole-containing bacteriocin maturation protein n=1 Tax=Bacillus sonorensis TaxID=119858 RepID=UPI0022E15E8F|nr:putative thiazole-containing bacteriocin maturation protein [Bacillus sonorensis]
MTNLTASARLKVKQDTCFLPDPAGGVYVRNNSGSFRMKGASIYQWIEKLLPMFNGEHTLEELTNGLPAPYRDRVFDIGGMLYKNGFVRDVSRDRPHQLEENVLKKYASQIEFIESFADSGAYRFQLCRQANILVAGSGSFLISLVRSLAESGFAKIHVFFTEARSDHQTALEELEAYARQADGDMIELTAVQDWREAVKSCDWILYASEIDDPEKLLALQSVCREEKKRLFPAVCLKQIGLAGPFVHQDGDGCFESAWRRIHRSALQEERKVDTFPAAGKDMLANVIVFELFKTVSGLASLTKRNECYLVDLSTLEGVWCPFLPHPLVSSDGGMAELVRDIEAKVQNRSKPKEKGRLFQLFSQLTSEKAGIFRLWEEKHLKQLPLSQCFVQVANPLSEGPAELLEKTVCSGFTHEEARREAGLKGIEMYGAKLADVSVIEDGFLGIGTGETIAESVLRGLQKSLDAELQKRAKSGGETASPLSIGMINDKRAAFYLNALSIMHGTPEIGLGKDISGFPVVWTGVCGRWYGSAGINITLALRNALQQALMNTRPLEEAAVILAENKIRLDIPVCEDHTQLLDTALKSIRRNGLQLLVYDVPAEPFFEKALAGIYAVRLKKEEA